MLDRRAFLKGATAAAAAAALPIVGITAAPAIKRWITATEIFDYVVAYDDIVLPPAERWRPPLLIFNGSDHVIAVLPARGERIIEGAAAAEFIAAADDWLRIG